MLTGNYILRNLVSYIRLIKHCFSNIFLINCICFGEPLWAAFFKLLLNRPDDYVLPACSSMIKLRVQDWVAWKRWLKSLSYFSFPNHAWFLLLRAVNFYVKPITQQFLHVFHIFFPARVTEFQKFLVSEKRDLSEKGENQQQTQRSYIASLPEFESTPRRRVVIAVAPFFALNLLFTLLISPP